MDHISNESTSNLHLFRTASSNSNLSSILLLQSFHLPPSAVIPAFVFASLNYMIILLCNFVLLFTILLNRSLHQPQYLLLLNLPINDIIGTTGLFPQVINKLLFDTKSISYAACIAQAFLIHIYAAGSIFILTAMAYDRYVAICRPLQYGTIMTPVHVIRIITLVWFCCVLAIICLFLLHLRVPRCRSQMAHSYCDSPSLLQLVCGDTTINNIYGLSLVTVTQVVALGIIFFTYIQILVACFRSKRPDTKTKALQTCATHLIVFLLLECLGLFTIISYRIPNLSSHTRRFIGVSTLVFPPTLNPIIYGLKTKEIKDKIFTFFRSKTHHLGV